MQDIVARLTREHLANPGPVNVLDIVHYRPYVEALLGVEWLEPRLAALTDWVAEGSDPVFVRSLLDRPLQSDRSGLLTSNMLVAAVWATRSWEAEWRVDPTFRPQAGVMRLLQMAVSLAVVEMEAGDLMDAAAVKLRGQRLRSQELWSLIHEAETFASFVRMGTNPTPHFLHRHRGPDFTAYWNGRPYPVECTAKLPGAGRFVKRDLFTRLGVSVGMDMKRAHRRVNVTIEVPDSMTEAGISAVREVVRQLPDNSPTPTEVQSDDRNFRVTVEPLDLRGTDAELRSTADALDVYARFLVGDPIPGSDSYQADAMVCLKADAMERPQPTIGESIDDAARQLLGLHDGIVAVHFFDAQPLFRKTDPLPEWLDELVCRKLDQYPHLMGIIVSTEPDLQQSDPDGKMAVRLRYRRSTFPADFPFGEEV